MLTVEQLIQESQDPRLHKLPNYARELIHLLATRLKQEASYAQAVKERAEKEVDELRVLLADGPTGSDTFMDMPRTTVAGYEDDQRPLGTGTTIEFRAPSDGPGEGVIVSRQEDGRIRVHGINHLAVIPVGAAHVFIETR